MDGWQAGRRLLQKTRGVEDQCPAQARDDRDTNRAIAPLAPAEGALVLDTSEMNADQAVDQVLAWYAAVTKQ